MQSFSKKLGIIGGSITVFTVVVGFVAFDEILKFIVRDQTVLRQRNQLRGIYLKIPFPLDFRIYFFNVTNPMEVQKGAIPDLKEVGPYTYDEYVEKIDVVDDNGDDSLTYSPFHTFIFNQEKSGNLTDDDSVTILHPLLVGMINQVKKEGPALLPLINKAIGALYPGMESIYLTDTVRNILFEEMIVNCKGTGAAGKAVCSRMKSRLPGIKVTENELLYSLLGPRNATPGVRVKISRGISKFKDLGKVLEIDDKRKINLWSTTECNTFRGTDSWIFPGSLTPEAKVHAFSTDICRSVKVLYVGQAVVKGFAVFRYEFDFGDMEHNEEDKCYCDTPKTCLKKGVFDVSKCMGVPILVTLPHFLRADESLLKQVKGMDPDMEKHSNIIYLEPMTAAPIKVYKRVQFNIQIAPNSKITMMKNIPEALHPLFWIEESVDLEGPLLKELKVIFLALEIIKAIRWFGIIIGSSIIGYAVYDYFSKKKDVKVTPIHNVEANAEQVESGVRSSSSSISQNESTNGRFKSVLNGHEFDRYKL